MNYIQFHVGDWDSSTRLLSPLEKGIYIDLLMLYYSTERPIMRSECERISRAYATEERQALEYVLERFFHRDGDAYVNRRCEEEIAKAAEKSKKAKKSADARWNKASRASDNSSESEICGCERNTDVDANGMRTHSERSADGMLTNNQEPITSIEGKESKKERHAITQAFNLSSLPSDWSDYCKQARPDLDPQTVFLDFAFYFTKGQGKDNRRSEKGWAQSWQGWVRRQKEVRAPKAPQEPKSFADVDYSVGINPDGSF